MDPGDILTQLPQDLSEVEGYLHRSSWLTLSPEENESLLEEVASLRSRINAVQEEILCLGFLGGTGVGKSTLLNRLAGAEVASTSHRRPHTERALLYLHHEASLPGFLSRSNLAYDEHRHGIEAIRSLLVCDLPDFDSLAGEHRQTVLQVLEHLDLLVWISSPEKYADRAFYGLLREVPKSGSNFVFVLNKADQLVPAEEANPAPSQLQEVSQRFLGYLRSVFQERGETSDPAAGLYLVSATAASEAWNQLPLFREHLFTRRSLKQISRIKTANLQEEIRSLYRPLRSELSRLKHAESVLRELSEKLSADEAWWSEGIASRIDAWLQEEIHPLLVRHPAGLRLLVGPGRWIGAAVFEWRRSSKGSPGTSQPEVPEELQASLRQRLQQLRDRTSTALLQRALPQNLRQRIEHELQEHIQQTSIQEDWGSFVATALEEYVPPSRLLFRTVQKTTYALLVALCLLALGGKGPWLDMVQAPSAAHLLQLFFSLVQGLFSPSGLAALLSFGLLGTLAGFRFYSRFHRLAEERAGRYTAALAEQLKRSWQEQGRELLGKLQRIRGELSETAERLEGITKGQD